MKIKKFLIVSGLIIIIAALTSGRAFAESKNGDDSNLPLSNQQLFSKMLTEIGVQNPDYNFNLSEIFGGGEKNYGQNLYMAIYQKTVLEPEKEAVKIVGGMKGLTMPETNAVLNGSVLPLMQKNPRVSQETVFQWMTQMQDLYKDYIDVENLRSEMESIAEPSEIFANNDTSDSGFDLIVDLNRIEDILFKRVTPSDINIKYSGGLPSEAVTKPQTIPPGGPQPEHPYPQTGQISGGLQGEQAVKPGEISDYAEHGELCPSNPNFEQALKEYEKNNPSGPPKSSSDAKSKEAGSKDEDDIFALDPDMLAAEQKELKAAEPGKWENILPCGKTVCLEITTHSSTYNAYSPTDPCIACHVETINKFLKKTVSHSLAPRKLTGNLMEISKCKKGYSFSDFVNINIILVPMPIITPQKNDAIFGKNIVDEFKKFIDKFTLFKINESFDKAAEIVDAMANPETTQIEMYDEVRRMISKEKMKAAERVKNLETATKSSVQGEFFQSLAYELDQMNSFFQTFKELLTGITETCDKIKNKENVE